MSRVKDLYHNEICANSPEQLYYKEIADQLNELYGPSVKPKPEMVRKFVSCPDGLEGCAVAHFILTAKVSAEKVLDNDRSGHRSRDKKQISKTPIRRTNVTRATSK